MLINVLLDQPVTGFAASLLPSDYTNGDNPYQTALILLCVTALLFGVRSLLSVLGLWMTIGAANSAQSDLVARLLVGRARFTSHPRRAQFVRDPAHVLVSVDQVIAGIVSSSVSLVSDGAIVVAVVLGLVLSSPPVALTVTAYFCVVAIVWVRVVRGGLARRGQARKELQAERFKFVLQGISAAKELQLRAGKPFYANEAIQRTRAIDASASPGEWRSI